MTLQDWDRSRQIRSAWLNTWELPAPISWQFCFSYVGISWLFLSQFPEKHKVQALDVSRLPSTHWSICCLYHVTTAEFLPSHFRVSQDLSPPAGISSTVTPTMPWYFCCVLLENRAHGSKTDVSSSRPLTAARTVPPFSRAIEFSSHYPQG